MGEIGMVCAPNCAYRHAPCAEVSVMPWAPARYVFFRSAPPSYTPHRALRIARDPAGHATRDVARLAVVLRLVQEQYLVLGLVL